jgi:hypothetical protein
VVLSNQFARIVCRQLRKLLPEGEWRCDGRVGVGREVVDLHGEIAKSPCMSK